jgi:hypothetical protein
VTDTLQRTISKMRPGAANVGLMFMVVLAFGVVATQSAHAQIFTVLHTFAGRADGTLPIARLILDATGVCMAQALRAVTLLPGTVFKVDNADEARLLTPSAEYPTEHPQWRH